MPRRSDADAPRCHQRYARCFCLPQISLFRLSLFSVLPVEALIILRFLRYFIIFSHISLLILIYFG